MRRSSFAVVAAFFLLATLAAPVAAAAPANDDPSGATVVTEPLPFVDSIDTTEATSGADDAIGCGGPDVIGSVWYMYQPSADVVVQVSTDESDYLAGTNVLVGSPGSFENLLCALGTFQIGLTAGTQYWFLVTPPDAESPAGNLVWSIDVAPPPLQMELTIDARASLDRSTGILTVSGTVTCDREALIGIDGSVRQRAGRIFIDAFFFAEVLCTPDGATWTAEAIPQDGRLAGGKATANAFAFAFDEDGFAEASAEVKIGK
jgi:hypothetical protein